MVTENILITGASGQLGAVLTEALQLKFGVKHVIASDLRTNDTFNGIFKVLDVTNPEALKTTVEHYKITQIYHLAAILSAKGEAFPLQTWDINMSTFFNVLEVARLSNVKKVFFPSSIAVFGSNVSCINTPQFSNLSPSTVYGISKVAGENWANYYFKKWKGDTPLQYRKKREFKTPYNYTGSNC